MVLARIKDKLDESRDSAAEISAPEIPSAEHAIALREQAPELYDLWLKIAQEKAATENYVDRAPYEVPERLAQSGRPRALGALIIVLSFCGYLAWLGGPGPYIGGLIAILDLGAMFGMFFGLRPESLPETHRADRNRHLPGRGGLGRAARDRAASGRAALPGAGRGRTSRAHQTHPVWPAPRQADALLFP
jgi:hypothetical protein